MPTDHTEGEPLPLNNHVATLVDDEDLAMIKRVMRRYGGISKSAAVRILIRSGATQHDPSLPEEGTDHDRRNQ